LGGPVCGLQEGEFVRQKVQTLLCDRCGEPYFQDLRNEKKVKNVDLRCDLDWEDPEEIEAPRKFHIRFKDLCQGCAARIQGIFATLVFSREYDRVDIAPASKEEIERGQKPEKEEG
jgi:hypothetical protein